MNEFNFPSSACYASSQAPAHRYLHNLNQAVRGELVEP